MSASAETLTEIADGEADALGKRDNFDIPSAWTNALNASRPIIIGFTYFAQLKVLILKRLAGYITFQHTLMPVNMV